MTRFRFRLAGLLRLRSQLERTSRRSLATAMGAVANVEQRIENASTGLSDCEQMGCGTGAAAPLARALAQGLIRHRQRLQHELRAAHAQLDRCRTEWLERRRDVQALSGLREKQLEEWRRVAAQQEQNELEELARCRTAAPRSEEEMA